METYQQRPYDVKASKFTGGEASAKDICDGLTAAGYLPIWRGPTPYYGDVDPNQAEEMKKEHISIRKKDDDGLYYTMLYLDNWIVIHPDRELRIFEDEDDFHKNYQKPDDA